MTTSESMTPSGAAAARAVLPTWVALPEGSFLMGSYDFYPDEAPAREEFVGGFEITQGPVTNAQFAAFVAATGYVTLAERRLEEQAFPELSGTERAPGSLVFTPTSGPVDLRDRRLWWRWVPGAQWRRPLGPDSDLTGRENHPVVQVAWRDAQAYASWLGARLPTEAEHEYAAGGGISPNPYVWGRERDPAGVVMANTWHGRFPYLNTGARGWVGTSPVGTFPPNGFGLHDCIGNVWEWTADLTAGPAGEGPPGRILKGGSHLSAPEYALSYRPAAREVQPEDSASSHIGFRCARDLR